MKTMKAGGKEHKQIFYDSLISQYYENTWTDEIQLDRAKYLKTAQEKALAGIVEKIAAKGYNSKNEGDKDKFVAERQLLAFEAKIAEHGEKLKDWKAKIEEIEGYKNKQ